MKTIFNAVLCFVVMLGFVAGAALAAPPSEKKQAIIRQEIEQKTLALIQAYEKADVEAVLKFYWDDPSFLIANEKGKVRDSAAYRKAMQADFQNIAAEMIHTRKQELRILSEDTVIVAWQGPCEFKKKDGSLYAYEVFAATFVFKRIGGDWKIIYSHESGPPAKRIEPVDTTTAVLGVPEEAAIKAEVSKAFDAFKVAVEKVDLAAVLAVPAVGPDFRYVMADGSVADLAAWKQGHVEYFPAVSAHRLTHKSQQISVLGPEAAIVTWTGVMDIIKKDGAVLRVDPFSGTFVFKRIEGVWKLVQQHESCPPAKPVGPAASVEADLRAADAELVAAANARDLERWLACFEPDATLVPPGAPPIVGINAIRSAAAELMKSPGFAVVHAITKVEVLPSGASAWVTYDFELTANGEDGRPVTEKGTDTTLYRKSSDGRWRVLVDMWKALSVHP
jgi:uncharacterized protein (TIGR02246 family)